MPRYCSGRPGRPKKTNKISTRNRGWKYTLIALETILTEFTYSTGWTALLTGRLGRADEARAREQAFHDAVEALHFLLAEAVQEITFELQRQRCNLIVQRLAVLG